MMFPPIQLQLLNTQGLPTVTLHLPMPMEGYPQTSWEADEIRKRIPGVGLRVRTRGFRPIVKVKWKYYDERPGRRAIGTAEGQTPSFQQLLAILSLPGGSYRIGRPGAWVTIETVEGPEPHPVSGFAAEVSLTFHGRKVLPSRSLEP
jgi:hypothetical protein